MKILDAKVKPNLEWANSPDLVVLVDEVPSFSEALFTQHNTMYVADTNGYVRYYYYQAPGDGFGGGCIDLKMSDGTTKTLIGPWSSRAGVVNRIGCGPVMDVIVFEKREEFERGYTGMIGCLRLELALEAARMCNEKLLQYGDGHGEFYYVPTWQGVPKKMLGRDVLEKTLS